MRRHQIIAIAGLGVLWVLGGACGQESTPPKPVVKRITKQEKAASAHKPATQKKVPAQRQPVAGGPAKVETGSSTKATATQPRASASTQKVAYIYVPKSRPDPFRPFFEAAERAAPECEDMVPGPLTERDVSRFSLVAVVKRGKESVAMVQDTEGKGYVLRMGTYVGKKCGKVTQIDDDGVIVEEPYQDLLGQKKTRKVSLAFQESEGGGP